MSVHLYTLKNKVLVTVEIPEAKYPYIKDFFLQNLNTTADGSIFESFPNYIT